MRLFGFEIKRPSDEEVPLTFAPESKDDGAVNIAAGGAYGQYVDLDGTIRTEAELVNKYRQMSMNPEIDTAIDEITNEAIVYEDGKDTIELILDDLEVDDNFKKSLQAEFDQILKLMEFNTKAYEIFKAWYRDGRIYYHVVADPNAPERGITELRYLDPRKIRKVKENHKKQITGVTGQNVSVYQKVKEYFLYSEKGFLKNAPYTTANEQGIQNNSAIKIAKDSILLCTSGLQDVSGKMILSYLHKAIRPLNQLRALEDATIIYRLSRAPERRIFYIDVGSLPKAKAEQYLADMMTKYKNRLVYNAETGEIRDDRRFLTMLEDFWLPRREGGRGTEISTLPAGQNLGELEDVKYFQRKLYKSLNVPISRLEPETVYNVGRNAEITRDEVKFAKFIDRLRLKFSELFLKALEVQLIMKQYISPDEWEAIKDDIKFQYLHDNYFSELKESEIYMERFNRLTAADPYAGKYISHEWIRRNILRQADDEIEEIDAQIEVELSMPQYNPPPPPEPFQPPGFAPQQEEVAVNDEILLEDYKKETEDDELNKALKTELVKMLSTENEEESK